MLLLELAERWHHQLCLFEKLPKNATLTTDDAAHDATNIPLAHVFDDAQDSHSVHDHEYSCVMNTHLKSDEMKGVVWLEAGRGAGGMVEQAGGLTGCHD